MPTSAQAKNIANVKFGKRKLTSPSALALFNKHANDGKHTSFFAAFVVDTAVVTCVQQINDEIAQMFIALGLQSMAIVAQGLKFTLTNENECSIPKAIWNGIFRFPPGAQLSDANYAQYKAHYSLYKAHCGQLRARFAKLWAAYSFLNDVANVDANPNPGGVVTGHDHGGTE